MKKIAIILVSLAMLTSWSCKQRNAVVTRKANDYSYLLPVTINKKCGYVNGSGKIVIEPRYDFCNAFCEGLAMVQITGKTGFINTSGAYVMQPSFKAVPFETHGHFHEGRLGVRINGKFGFLDA